MKKLLAKAIAVVLGISACGAGLIGCTRTIDHDQFLEIYCLDVGYGYQWAEVLLEDFKQQDWVKEKYPNIDGKVRHNDQFTYVAETIGAGPNGNSADIMFTDTVYALFSEKYNGVSVAEDLTQGVYKQTVPGESRTYEDKMLDTYLSINMDPDSDNAYRSVNWQAGMISILYNADLFELLGLKVPNTTDELIQIAKDVKAMNGENPNYQNPPNIEAQKGPRDYAFTSSPKVDYWRYVFPVWWAQYEGLTEYTNFFRGIVDNTMSRKIFEQQGRLESLTVMDTLLSGDNGYFDPYRNNYEFMQAQTNFLTGDGLMMVCGDWFDREMHILDEGYKEQGIDYDLRMMRMPVISAIVDKTPSIVALAEKQGKTPDQILSDVIAQIDAGATSYEGVEQADFNKVYEARCMMYTIGPKHGGIIPSYATAKDVAMDFLLYMATDRANQLYAEATYGASLPFEYNLQEKAPEYYETISSIQKDRISYVNASYPALQPLPDENTFPLVYYGGMSTLISLGSYGYETFMSRRSEGGPRATGMDLYYDDIEYWTEARWQSLRANAGM